MQKLKSCFYQMNCYQENLKIPIQCTVHWVKQIAPNAKDAVSLIWCIEYRVSQMKCFSERLEIE